MNVFAPPVVPVHELPVPVTQFTWDVSHVGRMSVRDRARGTRTTIVPETLTVRTGDGLVGDMVRVDGRNRSANGRAGQHPRSIIFYELVVEGSGRESFDALPDWVRPYVEYAREHAPAVAF